MHHQVLQTVHYSTNVLFHLKLAGAGLLAITADRTILQNAGHSLQTTLSTRVSWRTSVEGPDNC